MPSPTNSGSRRAFSLVEALLASLVAFVAAGIWVGAHTYQARQDRDVDNRIAALDEARAVMESLVAKPFRDLLPTANPVPLPPATHFTAPPGEPTDNPFRKLQGAELKVHIHPYADGPTAVDPAALEIDVVASWLEEGNRREMKLVSVKSDSSLEDLP